MKHIKALFTVLFNLVMCFVIGLGLTMFIAKINPLDLPKMLFPEPRHQMNTIEAVSNAIEWFMLDYEDCNHDFTCTIATGLTPNESYFTPVLMSFGYTKEQTELVLTLIVDTFGIYQG
jgi:hypothetical protein